MSETIIITHDNAFHMDDAIGCFMLLQCYPGSTLIRTRDASIIEKGTFVVDVGGVYNPEKKRYDHHQRGFNEVYGEGYSIKLSSAGLVYKHHGKEFLAAIGVKYSQEYEDIIIKGIYNNYFMSVDANDNGIDIASAPLYRERSLDDIVKGFYPDLNGCKASEYESIRYAAFLEAMQFVGSDLVRFCRGFAQNICVASPVIDEAVQKSSPTDRYIVIDKSCMFSELVPIYNQIYHRNISVVIYPRYGSDQQILYSIMCLRKKHHKYEPATPLLEEWRGLRNEQLSAMDSNLKNCIFVHATGFCGSAKTLSCAIYMVQRSLEEYKEDIQ